MSTSTIFVSSNKANVVGMPIAPCNSITSAATALTAQLVAEYKDVKSSTIPSGSPCDDASVTLAAATFGATLLHEQYFVIQTESVWFLYRKNAGYLSTTFDLIATYAFTVVVDDVLVPVLESKEQQIEERQNFEHSKQHLASLLAAYETESKQLSWDVATKQGSAICLAMVREHVDTLYNKAKEINAATASRRADIISLMGFIELNVYGNKEMGDHYSKMACGLGFYVAMANMVLSRADTTGEYAAKLKAANYNFHSTNLVR